MTRHSDLWPEISVPAPESARAVGGTIRSGDRVRISPPSRGADVIDLTLAGRLATVERIDVTVEGETHLSVTIDDDPGRDFGGPRYPGHRFFFRVDEVELLDASRETRPAFPRVLVAGVGNIFFGDDAFGVVVARRLGAVALPAGVVVADFGIRGLDLAYALQDYDAVIIVDAVSRGGPPGTVYVIEPDHADDVRSVTGEYALNTHGLDPWRVLQIAKTLGRVPQRIAVVGCEPESLDDGSAVGALSPSVTAAVDGAAAVVQRIIAELNSEPARPMED